MITRLYIIELVFTLVVNNQISLYFNDNYVEGLVMLCSTN